jgi:hypothetical protein
LFGPLLTNCLELPWFLEQNIEEKIAGCTLQNLNVID